jgi:GTP:adenosylcobinamide-phosphate guanylyltransferase
MRVIILAGSRPGAVDPLASTHNVTLKCLVPIAGHPLIVHVVRAVAANRAVTAICIVVEPEATAAIRAAAAPFSGTASLDFVAAHTTLADSVIAAMAGHDAAAIITTADNVLLTPAALDAMFTVLGSADVALAMARKASVLAAHPDGQRRFYRFADDEFSNCNLYGLSGAHALPAAETFRGGGQFAKKASRIIDAFGLFNLILFRLGRLSLDDAMTRISRRIGVRIRAVILDDGRHAIDVDNERTYRVAEQLLRENSIAV